MQRTDFRCFHRLRVRWAEVDMQKIVFNAHYLMYIDTAMSDYWRALALPYEAGMQTLGGEMYVKKATVEYHASARLDDTLDVGLRCARVGTSSSLFQAGIFAGDQLLVSGELIYVFADPATQTSRPVPPALRAIFESFEAGAEMAEVKTGDWNALGRDASRLRTEVFVREQGIAPDIEADALDATARHAVVYNRLGMPVATGRLLQQAPGVARIGRMAVDRSVRGAQWGRELLEALVAAARARGDTEVQLHAQRSAEGFYRRAGFAAAGDPWEEAGIAHIAMSRQL
ncbi:MULTISPECIES: YbgC/FadM family acyl-CoA thioesterase [unclassified Acidovorax]|jgi:YbgC/YbaW family acyl-CoA thioester hydrolase|uniref:YbgC/FadM family acyl-CoA thioesterase n=1 Tax=unclassified Acidovorax TaxID=2684926 RepID=UPI00023FC925|nr:YbgC/FadM family acyl-CoA thioesterase [Acidovorax sp. NO-1]EHL20847.1 GCN5-like N-acetyltransferase [Acidovorax sp. NO-1]